MLSDMWDETSYPFTNFNNATIEVWELINDFNPHFTMDVPVKQLRRMWLNLYLYITYIHTEFIH